MSAANESPAPEQPAPLKRKKLFENFEMDIIAESDDVDAPDAAETPISAIKRSRGSHRKISKATASVKPSQSLNLKARMFTDAKSDKVTPTASANDTVQRNTTQNDG